MSASFHTTYDIHRSLMNFVAESCCEAAETGTHEQNRVQARGILHDSKIYFYKINKLL